MNSSQEFDLYFDGDDTIRPVTPEVQILTSPHKIGSSATAIGVAFVPVIVLAIFVAVWKLSSWYFQRNQPQQIYLKRASTYTTCSSLSVDFGPGSPELSKRDHFDIDADQP